MRMKFNNVMEVVSGSGYSIGWNVCRSYNFFRFSFGYVMVFFFFVDDNYDDDMEFDDDLEFSLNLMVDCFFNGISVF